MPIPNYETFMLPVLRLFGEGAKNINECLPKLKDEFGITDEEAEEPIPSVLGMSSSCCRRTRMRSVR